jgi:hypothetical protein
MPPEDSEVVVKNCMLGIKNETRIDNMARELSDLKTKQSKDREDLFNIIGEIRDKLLGRPSWAVLFIMTAMSSGLVGLLILLVKQSQISG